MSGSATPASRRTSRSGTTTRARSSTPAGRLVAQAAHIPVHLGSTPLSVHAALAAHRPAPGDVIAVNDPYAGGTHLPDLTLVAPVHVPGRPPARVRRQSCPSCGHRRDDPGLDAARARDLPGGVPSAAGTSRARRRARGGRVDPLPRQHAGSRRASRRSRCAASAPSPSVPNALVALAAELGAPTLARGMSALQGYSERLMAATLARVAARRVPRRGSPRRRRPRAYRGPDSRGDPSRRGTGASRFHRHGAAGRRQLERQLRHHVVGRHVRLHGARPRGDPPERRGDAAPRRACAGGKRRQRRLSGGGRRRQRGDVTAHRRRLAAGARDGGAGPDPGRELWIDEQSRGRRLRPAPRARVLLLRDRRWRCRGGTASVRRPPGFTPT